MSKEEGKAKKERITFTLDPELITKLKETSKRTLIPQSRLVEKTLAKVIEEYKHSEKGMLE